MMKQSNVCLVLILCTVPFLKTCCASAFAWERGRLARPGKGLTALHRRRRASGQDGRAPRDCTSSSVEMQ